MSSRSASVLIAVLSDGNPRRHYGTGRHWKRQAAMAQVHLAPGDVVRWLPDDDLGVVKAVTHDGQGVAVLWDTRRDVEWYSLCCGAMSFIEKIDDDGEEDWR